MDMKNGIHKSLVSMQIAAKKEIHVEMSYQYTESEKIPQVDGERYALVKTFGGIRQKHLRETKVYYDTTQRLGTVSFDDSYLTECKKA